jgi:hypothetical protein
MLDLDVFVTIVRARSRDATAHVPKPIGLFFMDGDHGCKGVKADWDCSPHLSKFGLVIFHDTIWACGQTANGVARISAAALITSALKASPS